MHISTIFNATFFLLLPLIHFIRMCGIVVYACCSLHILIISSSRKVQLFQQTCIFMPLYYATLLNSIICIWLLHKAIWIKNASVASITCKKLQISSEFSYVHYYKSEVVSDFKSNHVLLKLNVTDSKSHFLPLPYTL